MLTWLQSTTEGAGLGRYGATTVLLAIMVASAFVGLTASSATGIPAFGLCLGLGLTGLLLEFLTLRARARRRALAKLWPEVIDSLISAASAGISLVESFAELASEGPEQLRPYFQALIDDFDSGTTMVAALQRLKLNLGEIHADRLIELTKVVIEAGGEGYVDALKSQSQLTRDDLALWGELESKQGWITGTAKMAVAAPWLIVAMLSVRAENAAAYASPAGSLILLVGLAMSLFAYRFIQLLGGLTSTPRVFA